MSVKTHIATAFIAVKALETFGKRVMDSDTDFALEVQKKVFAAIPQERLLRYERLVADELRKRRSA